MNHERVANRLQASMSVKMKAAMDDTLKTARSIHRFYVGLCLALIALGTLQFRAQSADRALTGLDTLLTFEEFPKDMRLSDALYNCQIRLEEAVDHGDASLLAHYRKTVPDAELDDMGLSPVPCFKIGKSARESDPTLKRLCSAAQTAHLRSGDARPALQHIYAVLNSLTVDYIWSEKKPKEVRLLLQGMASAEAPVSPILGVRVDHTLIAIGGPCAVMLACLVLVGHIVHVLQHAQTLRSSSRGFAWIILFGDLLSRITTHTVNILVTTFTVYLCASNARAIVSDEDMLHAITDIASVVAFSASLLLSHHVALLNWTFNSEEGCEARPKPLAHWFLALVIGIVALAMRWLGFVR